MANMEQGQRCVVIDVHQATATPAHILQYVKECHQVNQTWLIKSRQKIIITFLKDETDHQDLINKLSTQFAAVNEVRFSRGIDI